MFCHTKQKARHVTETADGIVYFGIMIEIMTRKKVFEPNLCVLGPMK